MLFLYLSFLFDFSEGKVQVRTCSLFCVLWDDFCFLQCNEATKRHKVTTRE